MTEQITVRGYVATDPEPRHLPDGTVVVTFRLASTPRRYDKETRNWRDGHTNWFTVQAFRTLGVNVLASVQKGQPVVLVGKLKVRFWEGEHGRQTAVDLDAVSIGHDLALGTALFQRIVSSSPPAEQNGDRPGAPSEDGAAGPSLGGPAGPEQAGGDGVPGDDPAVVPDDVDPETGEIVDAGLGAEAGGDGSGERSRRQPATA